MAVAVGLVDAAHARPELAVPQPGCGKRRLLPGIGAIPLRRRDARGGMRSVLEHIVRARLASVDNFLNLGADQDSAS